MKKSKFFLYLLLILFIPLGYGQDHNLPSEQNGIYSDRITDDLGNPLANIKIEVKGKNRHTYSDSDGYFRIEASTGDVIILSKNGQRINSYLLNGGKNYEIEDLSEKAVTKSRYSSVTKKKKVTSYFLDSARFYLRKNPYKSIGFIEDALLNSTDNKTVVQSYSLLGDNYMSLQQYDLAVSNYRIAVEKSKDILLQIKLAQALAKSGKNEESTKLFQKIKRKKLSAWEKVIVTEGLGDNAQEIGDNSLAINYYKETLSIAEKHKISPKITEINTKIASVLSIEGRKNEATSYIKNSLEESKSEHLRKRVIVQNKVADIYQSNQDYDQEIQLRKQTLKELNNANIDMISIVSNEDKVNKDISTSRLNLDIGKAYFKKNEFNKAIPYLEESALKAKEIKDLETQKNAIQKLSELYKKIGNSKKALQKYQEYAGLVDKLYQQKEKEIEAAITLNNELRTKQNRINSLEKDRQLSNSYLQLAQREKELAKSNNQKQLLLIYALLIGLLLFSIVLFAMYRSNKQRRLANNLLALKSLRSQMNPHFIFNALNSVNSFIAQNDERTANRYLTDFSKLMRNVLNNSEKDFIPLSKEIELLELYLQLEHSRFQDKFDYKINIDKQLQVSDFEIPPMLLQPYVENAVWHGLRYKKEKGKLTIDFHQQNSETVIISIGDDGIGRKRSKELKTQNQKKQQSKGMNNIKKRIKILNQMYGDKVNVSITDLFEDKTGTKVILTLRKD